MGVSVILAYVLDVIVVAWKFEVRTSPADFLRSIINKRKDITKHENKLKKIFEKVKIWQIEEDLKREKWLEQRRQKRM